MQYHCLPPLKLYLTKVVDYVAHLLFSEDGVQRKRASDYFSSSKNTGPLTLNFEYVSIIRIRNLSRL